MSPEKLAALPPLLAEGSYGPLEDLGKICFGNGKKYSAI